MGKIRVSELFANTVQGEGLRTGHVSCFVRFCACNLKCENFGMKVGEKNTEIPMIITRAKAGEFKSYNELPLSKTGCDSYPSSWSEFKEFSPEMTYQEIYDKLVELSDGYNSHIDLVFTGGEPLLKPTQRKLVELLKEFPDIVDRFESITFETNGTQVITEGLREWIVNNCDIPVIFSISPKLACSGEPERKRIVPAAIESIRNIVNEKNAIAASMGVYPVNLPSATMYVKYVVSDEGDVKEAVENINKLGYVPYTDGDVYLMPVGGTFDEYMMKQTEVAELAVKYGFIFCCRVHQVVWANQWAK